MANNLTFPVTKIAVDGALTLDLDFDPTLLTLDRNGSNEPTAAFVNNGDGMAIVPIDSFGTGRFTVKKDGVAQAELTDIFLVTDNVLTQVNLNSTPAQIGYIYLDGGFLKIYTDGSNDVMHIGNLVIDLVTDSEVLPASASTVFDLKALIDAITVPPINTDITTGGNLNTVGAELLKTLLDYQPSTSFYTTKNNTPVQNIEALDIAIRNVASREKIVSWRPLYIENADVAGAADGNAMSDQDPKITKWLESSDVSVVKMSIPMEIIKGDSIIDIKYEQFQETSWSQSGVRGANIQIYLPLPLGVYQFVHAAFDEATDHVSPADNTWTKSHYTFAITNRLSPGGDYEVTIILRGDGTREIRLRNLRIYIRTN